MDGFSEKLHHQVESSLKANEGGGRPSLMMQHLMMVEKKKQEEQLIIDHQNRIMEKERLHLEEIEEKNRKKEKKKRKKKEKKEKKKERKRRKYDESSSANSSDEDEPQDLVKAAIALEKKKLKDIQLKKEEKRSKAEAKKRRLLEAADRDRKFTEENNDRERLREWRESELHQRYVDMSTQILEGPIEQMKSKFEPNEETIPLRFFSRSKLVAWEYPGPGGVGISYAPLIGAPPKRDMESEDEW